MLLSDSGSFNLHDVNQFLTRWWHVPHLLNKMILLFFRGLALVIWETVSWIKGRSQWSIYIIEIQVFLSQNLVVIIRRMHKLIMNHRFWGIVVYWCFYILIQSIIASLNTDIILRFIIIFFEKKLTFELVRSLYFGVLLVIVSIIMIAVGIKKGILIVLESDLHHATSN